MPVLPEVAEVIDQRLDGVIMQALNLHDVAKALPHPYDVVAQMASTLAHDFINDAYRIKSYISTVEGTKKDDDSVPSR